MAVSFKDLKRNSASSFEKLNQELSKINQGGSSNKDEKMWSCQQDKAGNGHAIIRFLPAPEGEDLPFARVWSHGFQGPGGWYIENSLTTLGQDDPVSVFNNKLWQSGLDSDKEIARKQKRRLNYYSNVYIVKDPANPENEGKVFLFRYGKKIFDKLNDMMNPQFDDETPINPFCFWEGANFRLRIRKFEGYPNYDKSEFEAAAPLLDDDEKMEEIWKQAHSLKELTDPKNFKSYEALEARLNKVLGTEAPKKAAKKVEEEELPWDEEPTFKEEKAPEPKVDTKSVVEDDDDDDLAFFKSLADD